MKPALRPAQEVCRRILENLSAAVVLFAQDMRTCYVNPAAEVLFAASARHLLGLTPAQLLPGAPQTAVLLETVFASGHPVTQREAVLALGPDRQATVDLTVMPLIEPGQEPALLVEMAQIDRQLRISREESLLAQQEATRELLRGLAHEVKNPLGGLRGAAQLLERELPDAALREYTQVIIGEADRLQALVDRMLGPNGFPQLAPVNIHEVLEHVRNLVQAEVGDGVHLHHDYDPSIPELRADPHLLIQAVLNIVRNATQAVGRKGNVTLRTRILRNYTIGSTRHKLVLGIEVVDDGPGVAPELKEKIFYPMVSSRPEGTGLGLSIAQSLIQQHGGLIECESRPGHTVFSILLPLASSPGGTP